MDKFKETTLRGHVQLCELRYAEIEKRLDNVESRLSTIENKVSSLKEQTQQGFNEIKMLLERNHSRRQIQIIATIGSVVCAAIAAIQYILTR